MGVEQPLLGIPYGIYKFLLRIVPNLRERIQRVTFLKTQLIHLQTFWHCQAYNELKKMIKLVWKNHFCGFKEEKHLFK